MLLLGVSPFSLIRLVPCQGLRFLKPEAERGHTMLAEGDWVGKAVGFKATGNVRGSALPKVRLELYRLLIRFCHGYGGQGRERCRVMDV